MLDEKVKLSLCEVIFCAAINSETGTTYLLLYGEIYAMSSHLDERNIGVSSG